MRCPLYYKSFSRLAKLHRQFNTPLFIELSGTNEFVYLWAPSGRDPQPTNLALALAYLIWPSADSQNATLRAFFPNCGARMGTLEKSLVERAAAAIRRSIGSHKTALFAESEPCNFYNGICRVPVMDIDRPGVFNNHLLNSTLEIIHILVDIKQLATLVALLTFYTNATLSAFSSNDTSGQRKQFYVRNAELPFLVRFLLKHTALLAKSLASDNAIGFRSLCELKALPGKSLSLTERNALQMKRDEFESSLRQTITDSYLLHQLVLNIITSLSVGGSSVYGELLSCAWPIEWLMETRNCLQRVLSSLILYSHNAARLYESSVEPLPKPVSLDMHNAIFTRSDDEESANLLIEASSIASAIQTERS